MSSPFIGQLLLVPYNFAPRSYAFCQGQSISISANDVLFSLLGTTFGGDGVNFFNLPDLRGRTATGAGQAPGLSNYLLGQVAGSETVTVTTMQLPTHQHSVFSNASNGSSAFPANNFLANGATVFAQNPTNSIPMSPSCISFAGGNGSHNNLMPFLVMNWCIALEGIYPPQS